MVLGRAMLLMAIGIAIGGAASWYFSAGVRSFLFGIQPTDSLTIAGVTLVLLLIGAFACLVPARRAAGTDPVATLRFE